MYIDVLRGVHKVSGGLQGVSRGIFKSNEVNSNMAESEEIKPSGCKFVQPIW